MTLLHFYMGEIQRNIQFPVYAIVTHCPPYKTFPRSEKTDLWNAINNTAYDKKENTFYLYVSYWIFFPYNEGKEVCFLGRVPTPRIFNRCFGRLKTMGNHIGDWEHMTLSFAGKKIPDRMFLAVHDAGVYYQYDENGRYFKFESKVFRKGVAQVPKFPQIVRSQGGHPVLFSAYGSHGLWASPGEHDFIRVPKLTDKNGYGIPWKTWSNLQIYHLGRSFLPEWMNFKGKWGNPKKKLSTIQKTRDM
ncbi:hypothetical protein NQ317_011518 [Molorchus minor]|uniref:Vacuolar protein sorting-associated protein 62 n=1 Tax=Molorchus minor TaxID=1323400 RepID=A0ABQ9J2A0_9CUCU|nr:hypothetical protein NQ317_011518 [Molorchus minor]